MALRFRRSIKIAPGWRINLSKSGFSHSFGVRGASFSIGKRGTYINLGIPGTGISSRARLDAPVHTPRIAASQKTSPKKELSDVRHKLPLMNKDYEEVINIFHRMKSPSERPVFDNISFDIPKPKTSIFSAYPKSYVITGIIVFLLFNGFIYEFLPNSNTIKGAFTTLLFVAIIFGHKYKNRNIHKQHINKWKEEKGCFVSKRKRLKQILDSKTDTTTSDYDVLLEGVLMQCEWPRETTISIETTDDRNISLDVDLPEIEDMPMSSWTTNSKGNKLIETQHSETQVRKDYMTHVHGIACVLLGEIFRTLPRINNVILSGYSQRINKSIGNIVEEYLYSVKVNRSQWEKINFDNLRLIDPVELLGSFDIRRNMTKTGIFTSIDPF
jgi:hypothetical protein